MAAALLLLSLWLLSHPYLGIAHDSIFYTAQAFYRLQPEVFGRDLFFAFGSQAEYTVFPDLYAAVIRLLGLDHAAIVLVALGQVVWVAGAAAAFRRLARGAALWLMLAATFAMPAGYAGYGLLSYGEGFATPRLYVEAIALFGFAALLGNRVVVALGLLLASAALHPLVVLPGLAAAVVYLVLRDRRWLVPPCAGAAMLVILALGSVEPFARLFETMDAEWLGVVEPRNRYVFPSAWRPQDWNTLGFDAAVTAAAAVLSAGRRRRIFTAVLAVGTSGVAVSLIGGDLLHNVLVIQLQTWRAAWLLHLFAQPALVVVLLVLVRRIHNGRTALALLAAAWFLIPFPMLNALGPVAAGFAVASARGRLAPVSRKVGRLLYGFTGLAALAWAGLRLGELGVVWHENVSAGLPLALSVDLLVNGGLPIAFPTQCATLGLLAAGLFRRPPGLRRPGMLALALAATVAAGATWDRRTEWVRQFESPAAEPAPFARLIPLGSQIYWEDEPRIPWFLLRRPNYVSIHQGAGVLFSRGTALEYRDRLAQVEPLGTRDRFGPFGGARIRHAAVRPADTATLGAACERAPGLDFMALTTPIAGRFLATWRPPTPRITYELVDGAVELSATREYYLYACQDFRD